MKKVLLIVSLALIMPATVFAPSKPAKKTAPSMSKQEERKKKRSLIVSKIKNLENKDVVINNAIAGLQNKITDLERAVGQLQSIVLPPVQKPVMPPKKQSSAPAA